MLALAVWLSLSSGHRRGSWLQNTQTDAHKEIYAHRDSRHAQTCTRGTRVPTDEHKTHTDTQEHRHEQAPRGTQTYTDVHTEAHAEVRIKHAKRDT